MISISGWGLQFEIAQPGMTKRVPAARSITHGIEGGIGTVDLHLMDNPKEAAQFATWPALLREPLKILDGQVVNWNAARWEVIGTKLAKWHIQPGNLREVRGHVVCKRVFHAQGRFATERELVNALRS